MALFPRKIIHSNSANKKGFTLIEIIVATLIIAALAGGLFGAFWGSQYLLNRTRHRVQAFNFAMESMDKLRSNYTYSSSPAMSIGYNHSETEISAGGIIKGELVNLSGALTYDVTEPQVNGYKEVTIKVHWNEPSF